MASTINITVSGFDELGKLLDQEPQNQVEAMIKAQTKLSTQAVTKLKRGLAHYGGRAGYKGKRKENQYKTSPKGHMPYKHTGRLQESIGYKMLAHKRDVQSKIGSGVMGNPIEYAKYLEGKNGDGIRPFLWAVQDLVTSDRLLAYFAQYYKPLQGGK